MNSTREPILNVPAVVLFILAVLVAVHAARELLLTDETDQLLLWTFAFIPVRYDAAGAILPGGFGAQVWTFVSYALLHANLMHLGFNSIWFVAFGSPVARRFGWLRFIMFFIATAVAGALAYLLLHAGGHNPMIGASAAISGMMGASTRFAFQPGGSLDLWRGQVGDPDRIPAAPLLVALRNPRVLTFLAVWFGSNLLFGVGSLSFSSATESVAWEAHIGGFLAGLLMFSLFDPIARSFDPPASESPAPPQAD